MPDRSPWVPRIRTALGAALALGLATSALAGTHIHSTHNPVATTADFDDGPQLLDLGGGHGTTFVVESAAPARLAIFFTAECTVAADDDTTWLTVDILVNGSTPALSDDDDALCTSNGDDILNGWFSASRDVFVLVPAGSNEIQIQAGLGSGSSGDEWRLDDLTLIVVEDED